MEGLSLRRIPPGQPGAGIAVVRLHFTADPTMNEEKVAALRAKYTSEARFRREMDIQYEALEGELLYPEWHRGINAIPEFDVSDSDRWTLYMGLDPHPRTAHACLWYAVNKHGDGVVCGELWPEFGTRYGPVDGIRWKVADIAEAIQMFESDSELKPSPFQWARGKRLKVFRRVMDTYGHASGNADEDEDYFELYRKAGIRLSEAANKAGKPNEIVRLNFDSAKKGHDNLAKAYNNIGQALTQSLDGAGHALPPQLTVFEENYETIEEFENVRFPEGVAETLTDERPISYQKHLLDCLAYIWTSRPRFVTPKRIDDVFVPQYPNLGY